MVRYIYYNTLFGPYLHSANGIKEFAELMLGELISKVARKSADYREMNENLLVEKASLRLLAEEIARKPVLDSGEFFSIRRRIWADAFLTFTILAAAVLVTYASLSALLDVGSSYSALTWLVSAVVAVVLIGGGLIATTRLLESLLGRPGVSDVRSRIDWRLSALWGLILCAVEVCLFGMLQDRSVALSTGAEGELVDAAFVMLGLMLPVLGGAVRWDMLRFIDVYKRTQVQRQVENRLAQIDSILRQNAEFESNYYKAQSLKAWRELNAFKAFKHEFDAGKLGRSEDLSGHFALSYSAFQLEANRRYGADIRDTTAPSFRKLDRMRTLVPASSGDREITEPIGAILSGGDGYPA